MSKLMKNPWLRFGLMLVTLITAHLAWLSADASPPGSDEAMYAKAALLFADAVTGAGDVSYHAIFDPAGARQPIPVWVVGIARVFGATDLVAWGRALNIIPLTVLALGVFLLTRRLGGEPAAVLAAAVSCLYLPIVHLARHYWAHYWLVAVVPLFLWALLRTEELSRRRESLQLAAIAAAGLLVRHFFVLFAAPAALVAVTGGLWSSTPPERRRRLVIAGQALFITLVVSAIHYAEAYRPIRVLMKRSHAGTASCRGAGDAGWETVAGLAVDLFWGGSPWIGVVLAGCTAATLIAARRDRRFLVCGASITILFALRLIYPCRVLAYAVPVVPVVIACGAAVFVRRWPRSTRFAFAGIALFAACIAARDFDSSRAHTPVVVRAPHQWLPPTMAPRARPVEETHLARVVDHLGMLANDRQEMALIAAAGAPFYDNRLDLELRLAHIGARLPGFGRSAPRLPLTLDFETLLAADVIIAQNLPTPPTAMNHRARNVMKPVFAELATRPENSALNFTVSLRVPAAQEIVVWRRTRPPSNADVLELIDLTLTHGELLDSSRLALRVERILRLDDPDAALDRFVAETGYNEMGERLRCLRDAEVRDVAAAVRTTIFPEAGSSCRWTP
jgi:hypothetical protein